MTSLNVNCPIVICGKCFHVMDITEWLHGFDTHIGNFVPHPNSSHRCNNCDFLWEPDSSHPADKMVGAEGVMFFWNGET